jgi:GAF domain-containing protein
MNTEKIFNAFNSYINNKTTVVADLANIAAIVYHEVPDLNWFGFYILNESKDTLELGPFQGKSAVALIDVNNGVCGYTVRENKTVIVNDVCSFPGHIACDINSKSEIVVPIYTLDNQMWAILDVDSPIKDNFTNEHKELFEKICLFIETDVLTKLK